MIYLLLFSICYSLSTVVIAASGIAIHPLSIAAGVTLAMLVARCVLRRSKEDARP